ncbi:MAG: YhgE/Pip domain-containing protein, partial [Collinsella intestinalis]
IPSLYAWYNIEANWDPYGSTEGVKIAVANEDAGVETELTGKLNAGEQTIDKLKENHDLGWVFTDAKKAEEGVRRGDYYAAIVIPHDFSEKLTSMLTGDFEQPELTYYVNEKKTPSPEGDRYRCRDHRDLSTRPSGTVTSTS